jgi:hypothetical protein
MSDLPCGCAHCGCICADHSPDRIPQPCRAHAAAVVAAFIGREAASLVALALFTGAVTVWCMVLI